MSGMQGADISQLTTLSGKFGTEAGNLSTLINHLHTATNSSSDYWKGPRADKFRDEWAQLKPTFEKFVTTLHEAQNSAKQNATNIQNATS
ncbi:WXG100 family type VII secretion target [Actinacidiphila yanglinensis]|uniref:WXG100 family type VII secretion target n=2 Tax=Actinacidiphila yanglinensis TaxID=310779 RepID=A0A1H5Z7Y3_9ACTN|nr:WXG100 family type VII secretion target [Actinacidiphila yanglinensis]